MANSFGVPGISVKEFAAMIAAGDDLLLVDVRETDECLAANIDDTVSAVLHLPLSSFDPTSAAESLSADKPLVIMCHHGIRSAQFTYWLIAQGYNNVLNLDGGIEAYATEIDPKVGRY